jgi:hypothetical protein
MQEHDGRAGAGPVIDPQIPALDSHVQFHERTLAHAPFGIICVIFARMRSRIIAAVVTAASAAGLVLGGAANAFAAPLVADVSYTVVATASHTTSGSNGCTAVLLSEQVTAGDPAYVSGYLQNVQAGKACAGWLERAASGGKTWTISSAVVHAPSAAGFTDWVKLGEQKDGPALKARVCFQVGTAATVYCTKAVSLKASPAPATGFPVALSYLRAQAVVGTPTSECVAYVSTSTRVKKAGTLASGLFAAFGATCTGYEQTSADGGKTWTTVSRLFVFSSKAPATVWSFTAKHPDGTGRLARACVALGAGKARCTTRW